MTELMIGDDIWAKIGGQLYCGNILKTKKLFYEIAILNSGVYNVPKRDVFKAPYRPQAELRELRCEDGNYLHEQDVLYFIEQFAEAIEIILPQFKHSNAEPVFQYTIDTIRYISASIKDRAKL